MSLTPDRFVEFFRAAHADKVGKTFDPFPWQERLAERVALHDGEFQGAWPKCLALPTGSGKTTAVDIAIFALACQATLGVEDRTAPRRIIFVVDRRVIVDEAFEHSLSLAGKLRDALRDESGGILLEVARALKSLAGGEDLRGLLPSEMLSRPGKGKEKGDLLPLTCHQLRGGVYRDDAWARTPLQPCVIASTVDQIGSRLLFRGYGCSFKSRPLHAGLAANDSLIILDEAHCARPFMETLLSVQKYRDQSAKQRVGGPFQFAIMSATPADGVDDPYRIAQADRDNEYLGRRITAGKPTTMIMTKAKGNNVHSDLAKELVSHAAGLINERREAIAILVNRVPTAKFCYQLLQAVRDPDCKESDPFNSTMLKAIRKAMPDEFDVVLMTGRMRSADKTSESEMWLNRLSASDSGGRKLDRPVIVVATQCLEVGANLDFDAMVAECASFDALRQRFGRLNRTGRDIPAKGVVAIRADQINQANDDPIYGTTLAATWVMLNENVSKGDDQCMEVDFGIEAMDKLWQSLAPERQRELIPESKRAPVMLPSHLDMWCQTSPEPVPALDPAIFLHGPDDGRPEVQVCWRSDISNIRDMNDRIERELIDTVSMTPPTSMECLSVPLAVFRRWLTAAEDDAKTAGDELTDATTGSSISDESKWNSRHTAIVWLGASTKDVRSDSKQRRKTHVISSVRDTRPGDTVVLPAEAGGWETLGHVPSESSDIWAIDIGDRCFLHSRSRASVRVTPTLIGNWFGGDLLDSDALQKLPLAARKLIALLRDNAEQPAPDDVLLLLKDIVASESLAQHAHWLSRAIPVQANTRDYTWTFLPRTNPDKKTTHWQVGIRGKRMVNPLDDDERDRLELTRGDAFTGDDEIDSASGTISITDHTNGVVAFARVFASLTLPETYVNAFGLAAQLHDLGKADPRFQAFLFGGDRVRASLQSSRPLAKSAGLNDVSVNVRKAWNRSELPDHFRHEMLSLQLAEAFDLIEQVDVHRDLILHLIATHHGYGRPFAPVCIDEESEPIDFSWLDDNSLDAVSESDRRGWTSPHQFDSGVAERFWKLVRQYGWWGLAWLESVFVLADRRRSEAEQFVDVEETLAIAHQQEICL